VFKNQDGDWKNPEAEHVVVLVSDGMAYFHNPQTGEKEAAWSRDRTVEAANELGNMGIVIHTVTLDQEALTNYGFSGSDYDFNASLCQNGGYAFHTPDAEGLQDIMTSIGTIELGHPRLIR